MHITRAVLTLSLALAGGAMSANAVAAAEPTEAAKKAARDLGLEGIKLFDAGKYAEALDKLDRAYAVIHAPTLGLWSAQAFVKLGRLVEASERYMEVRRMELPEDASAAFKQAQEAAHREYEELQPRIPRIEIVVEGAPPEAVEIFVDGEPVPASLVGTPHPVDPGARKVQARHGDRTAEETVQLVEGDGKRVVLALPRPAEAPPVAAPASMDHAPEADRGDGSSQRTLGWIGVGVGGAGLVFGTVTRVLAVNQRDDLEGDCVGNTCAPERADDVDAYNRLRVMSDVGLIAGGILLAGGGVLLLTAPSGPTEARGIRAWVGVASAGVKGAF